DLSVSKQQARAVTLSLLTGDRALITRQTKNAYQLAGISHLLAISGSHVLFLAIMLAGIATKIVDIAGLKLYRYWPRWQLRWSVMVLTAFVYAAFTGFDVPAARTAWMLVAIGVVRFSLLPISSLKVLTMLAVVMAWLDPFVLWQAGYWLSFIAVALLLMYERVWQSPQRRFDSLTVEQKGKPNRQSLLYRVSQKTLSKSLGLLKLQLWIFLTLLPLTLLLFQKASLWGAFINLFAIGWFGLVIVPVNLLAGLCYLISPTLADLIWDIVVTLVEGTHQLIDFIVNLPLLGSASDAWLYLPVNFGVLMLVALTLTPWLLPKSFLSRWLSLPPLMLLYLSSPQSPQSLTHDAQLEVNESLSPQLYLLEGPDDLSLMLLTNTKRQYQWLIMANYRGASPYSATPATFSKSKRLNSDSLGSSLQQQLERLSIDDLTGIIVQTASSNESDSLVDVAHQISLQRPVGYLWLAGASHEIEKKVTVVTNKVPVVTNEGTTGDGSDKVKKDRQNLLDNHARVNQTLPVTVCQAGQKWQVQQINQQKASNDSSNRLSNNAIGIQAITGWPMLEEADMSSCALMVQSRYPINIYQVNSASVNQKHQLANSNHAKLPSEIAEASEHRVIIDAATQTHLWPLYFKLCEPLRGNQTILANNENSLIHKNAIIIHHPNSSINEASLSTLAGIALIHPVN
ncbi:MAG: ComEC/Rec2 family competence protein, partial [Psychrobacter sp.]|nr:ComEC/Rec2 family competence protein [Psychrobacter sp.]